MLDFRHVGLEARRLAPTTLHNWLAIACLALHLFIVVRLLYLEQNRTWFGPEDMALIIIAGTTLSLLLISGLYLSGPVGLTTRVVHHIGGFAPAAIGLLFIFMVHHSVALRNGKRLVRHTLVLFIVNSALIFLAYWVSTGAAMGWWLYPERWSLDVGW